MSKRFTPAWTTRPLVLVGTLSALAVSALTALWLGPDSALDLRTSASVLIATWQSTPYLLASVLVVLSISVPVSLLLGPVAAYYGRLWDACLTFLVYASSALPTLVLLCALSVLHEPIRVPAMLMALGVGRGIRMARLLRSEIWLRLGSRHVLAAEALGLRPWQVLSRHLLPHALKPWLAQLKLTAVYVVALDMVLAVAGFSPAWEPRSLGFILAHGLTSANPGYLAPLGLLALASTALYLLTDRVCKQSACGPLQTY